MNRSKLFIGLFIALILIVITIVLLACTVFVVREVSVVSDVSSYLVNDEDIVESSGLTVGRSIITISKDKVKSSIEKDNPYVEVLSIRRVFPNKVIINVTVRRETMLISSSTGSTYAVVDLSMKVLDVIPSTEIETVNATVVTGLTFDEPEQGAQSLIGTILDFDAPLYEDILREIADFTVNYDLQGQSFSAFFKELSFSSDGAIVFIRTNKGVSLVLDKSLPNSIYDQMYFAMYYYTTSKDVNIDRTRGYIAYNKAKGAYDWIESLD